MSRNINFLRCFIRESIKLAIQESWDSPETFFDNDMDVAPSSQEVDPDDTPAYEKQAALNNQLSRKDNYAFANRSLASFKAIAPTKSGGSAGSSRRISPQFRIPRAYNSMF